MFYIKKKKKCTGNWQCSGNCNKLYFSEELSLKYLPEVEVEQCGEMIMNETLAVFTTFFEILQGGRYNSIKNSLSGRNPPGELLLMIPFN